MFLAMSLLLLTDRHLLYQVKGLYLGGTETTATALYWMVLIMVLYPDVQQKVYREIQKNLGTLFWYPITYVYLKTRVSTLSEHNVLFNPLIFYIICIMCKYMGGSFSTTFCHFQAIDSGKGAPKLQLNLLTFQNRFLWSSYLWHKLEQQMETRLKHR